MFRILFPRSATAELNTTMNESRVLKTYNQLSIEKCSRCSVKIGHNNKCLKCRFFLVPGDGPVLLRMPDIELLSIIRVMCEAIDNKTTDRKFDVQTNHAADSHNCKTKRDSHAKLDM